MIVQTEKLLTIRQLSEAIGIHPVTLHRYKQAGVIPFIQAKPGGLVRFNLPDVLAALQSGKKAG